MASCLLQGKNKGIDSHNIFTGIIQTRNDNTKDKWEQIETLVENIKGTYKIPILLQIDINKDI